MKLLMVLVCSSFVLSSFAYAATAAQSFPTSAGVVKITPLYHASTLIEAGGKKIYLDPAKPVKFARSPKADLILITYIHPHHLEPPSIAKNTKAGTHTPPPPPTCA